MNARALILVGTLALGVTGGTVAQQGATPIGPQDISLQDATDLAVRYNPVYRQIANDYRPAAWGVRNAYASFLPRFDASGSMSYSGAGTRQFGINDFNQPSATIGSSYTLQLNLTLDGNTLMQPGVQRAALDATGASIDAARWPTPAFTGQNEKPASLAGSVRADSSSLKIVPTTPFARRPISRPSA